MSNFELSRVMTTVNLEKEEVEEGVCGYFSNDLDSLRRAVENNRVNLRAVYAQLDGWLGSTAERRFFCSVGNFSLFYPMDKRLNESRY